MDGNPVVLKVACWAEHHVFSAKAWFKVFSKPAVVKVFESALSHVGDVRFAVGTACGGRWGT